uniref:protein-tyrosine-phosphatase n=1 Tax=Neobodo designis TaxID=312471 RepID=A0A7S1LEL6_NEODS|mmetsp:Transcript_20557/g.63949  ORF Transcript_20557/g.63949 Transcript_20557/m.63949 type:complete len:233 (+) Transcript_20557:77-775(+)
MMSRRRPPTLDLSQPAFNLSAVHEGSMEVEPVCAARCEPMSCIREHLFIGSWRDIEEPETLRAAGITHVLNVAKEVDPAHHDGLEGFCSMHIPLVDEHRENIVQHLECACTFIEAARNEGGRVLVHCRRGISRSPAIVVGYLMRQDGLEFDEAVSFVKQRRLCTSLNIAFREFLMAYETPTVKEAQQHQRAHSHTFDDEDGAHPTPGTSDGGHSEGAGHQPSQLAMPEARSP